MKKFFLSCAYALFISLNFSSRAASNVNWYVEPLTATREKSRHIDCQYPDAMKNRAAKKETDPPIMSLSFNLVPSDLNEEEKKICGNSLTNLLGLDDEKTRDEFAKILRKFPCDQIEVVTETQEDPELKTSYGGNIKSNWKTQEVVIKTCLKDQLPYCRLPPARHGDFSVILNHDSFMNMLNICLQDTENAIQAGKELNAWRLQNDPNKRKSGTQHY